MKNILVTRLEENSRELSHRLKIEGHRVFFEPLFTIEKMPTKELIEEISEPISAIIITSGNAISALENSKIGKDTKIFTVGTKTAKNLEEIGFKNIVVSPKNSAASLFEFVANQSGQILYLRGSVISFDFAQKLRNVREIFAYKTHEVENFSKNFAKIHYDEVMIFSKNSCEIFYKLASRHNLLEYFLNSKILCLSPQILEKAKNLGFKNLEISK